MRLVILAMLVGLSGCGYKNAYNDIHALQAQQQEQEAALAATAAAQAGINTQLLAAQQQINEQINMLESQVLQLQLDVAALQGYTGIVGIVDPCGNAPGKVDEVLLQLSNGQLLASFSDTASGLNTRFGVLGAGTYATTDGTGCIFTVSGSGVVSPL